MTKRWFLFFGIICAALVYIAVVIGIFYAPVREKIRLGYMMWRYPTVPQSEIIGRTKRGNLLENGWYVLPNSRLIKVIDDISAEVMLQDGRIEKRYVGEVLSINVKERIIILSNSGFKKTLTIPVDSKIVSYYRFGSVKDPKKVLVPNISSLESIQVGDLILFYSSNISSQLVILR